MYPASGDARNATAWAISSGVPNRPIGMPATIASTRAGLTQSWRSVPSVRTGPGATALTRMRWRAHSTARVRVRARTPAFAAAEGAVPGPAIQAYAATMFTIAARGEATSNGKAAREQRNVPSSTMPTTARQPFGEIDSAGAMKLPAALLTRRSRRPKSRRTRSTSCSTCAASSTSVGTSRPRAPAERSRSAPARRWSAERLAMARSEPSRARRSPMASPIPVPPPVTSATGFSCGDAGGGGPPARRLAPCRARGVTAAGCRRHGR